MKPDTMWCMATAMLCHRLPKQTQQQLRVLKRAARKRRRALAASNASAPLSGTCLAAAAACTSTSTAWRSRSSSSSSSSKCIKYRGRASNRASSSSSSRGPVLQRQLMGAVLCVVRGWCGWSCWSACSPMGGHSLPGQAGRNAGEGKSGVCCCLLVTTCQMGLEDAVTKPQQMAILHVVSYQQVCGHLQCASCT